VVTPGQGDIFWVRFGAAEDSSPAGKRPAIVIQNDLLNKSSIRTTVVALLTSNTKLSRVPWNVLLNRGAGNLPKTSVVVVTQMATVDKGRLLEKIGTIGKDRIEKIIEGCQKVISLSVL